MQRPGQGPGRGMTLALGALGALGLGALLASCYSPTLVSGFDCDPANVEPRCPDGFTCNLPDQKCYRPGELPGDIDAGLPGDGGVVVIDGGTMRAQPIKVSDGRRVALGTTSTGARLAFEDPPNVANPPTAQIRAVELDNDGNVMGSPIALSNSTVKPRDRLLGEGDQIAAFGWIEYDTVDATRQELWIHAGGNTGAQQISQQVSTGKGFPFDVVVRANRAYVIYADGVGTRLMARRIDGTPGSATMLTSAATAAVIDELDATLASDGDGLLVTWHEIAPSPTTGTREEVRVARFSAGNFGQIWNTSLESVSNLQRGVLRRPRVSASSIALGVAVAWENQSTTVSRGLPYGGGGATVSPAESDFAQPQVMVLPQSSGGMLSSIQSYLFGTHRASAADDRGPLLRRRVPAFNPALPDLGSRVAGLAVVGDADRAYIAGQDGSMSGGNVFAWGSAPGWAPGGLRVNTNTDAARPEVAISRRNGGGVHVAWVENGANEGQILVQTLKADSTTAR